MRTDVSEDRIASIFRVNEYEQVQSETVSSCIDGDSRVFHHDFYLFGRLKLDLQGMRFADDAVIQTVREWIRHQPQAFFETGIRMLPERWKKCVDSRGECIED
jgi:hypothetical protein